MRRWICLIIALLLVETMFRIPCAASERDCQHEYPEWEQQSWTHIRYCEKCQNFQSKPHVFTNQYEKGEEGHWLVCDDCGYPSTPESHVPGLEPDENGNQMCSLCGYSIVPVEIPCAAEETEAWVYNSSTHWQEDGSGVKRNHSMHKWDSGSKDSENLVTYTCTVCSATMFEDGEQSQKMLIKTVMAVAVIAVFAVLAAVVFAVLVNSRKRYEYFDVDD